MISYTSYGINEVRQRCDTPIEWAAAKSYYLNLVVLYTSYDGIKPHGK